MISRPFSIAVVAACPFPYTRGTPLRIQRFSEGLSAAGHTVHVFTYPIGNTTPVTAGVHISRIHNPLGYKKFDAGPSLQKPLLDMLLAVHLARFLTHSHIDVIYAHHFEGFLIALAARKRRHIPIVYDAHTTLRGELGTYHSFLKTRLISTLGQWLDSFVPSRSDYIISGSDEIAEFLQKLGIPSERIAVIPGGTEVEELANGNASRARETFNLDSRPIVIYTGNLAPFQGVDHLLAAMPNVLASYPDCQLVLAGNGDATPYLFRMTQLGIQHATHFIHEPTFAEVTDLLALADVAVVPRTVCPGTPQKLLNYMAAGKAIVAFEGSAKILSHLDTGYVIPNADLSALAKGIVTCLSDKELRKRLGAKAQQEAMRSYTWDRMVANISQVFERVVEEVVQ